MLAKHKPNDIECILPKKNVIAYCGVWYSQYVSQVLKPDWFFNQNCWSYGP